MPTIDFYFDFVSPYAFFANCRLPEIAAKHGYAIEDHSLVIYVRPKKDG